MSGLIVRYEPLRPPYTGPGNEGLLCPNLLCSHCGAAITAERKGMAMWLSRDAEAVGYVGDVPAVVLHKGACDRAYCEANGIARGDTLWEELGVFLAQLCHNTGTDVAQERRTLERPGGRY